VQRAAASFHTILLNDRSICHNEYYAKLKMLIAIGLGDLSSFIAFICAAIQSIKARFCYVNFRAPDFGVLAVKHIQDLFGR
jgi:hypothetical protein